jgi:hypothetical protein
MFFSRKPTAFILVDRDQLILYPRGKSEPLILPDDLVHYLELRDAAKLKTAIKDFATFNKLSGQRVLVMLDKSIVFQKAITVPGVDQAAAKADFETKVPFNPEDRQVLNMVQKDRQFLFGVNQSFYHVIVDALNAAGAKVQAVVPAVVYGVTDTEKLTHTKLEQIADAMSLTRAADLMGNT